MHGTAKAAPAEVAESSVRSSQRALLKAVLLSSQEHPSLPPAPPPLLPSALPQPKPPPHPPQHWLVLDRFYEKCRKHFIIWITLSLPIILSRQTQLSGQPEIWVSFQSPWNMKPARRQEKEGDIRSHIGLFLKEKGQYLTRLVLSLYEFLHNTALRWNS